VITYVSRYEELGIEADGLTDSEYIIPVCNNWTIEPYQDWLLNYMCLIIN